MTKASSRYGSNIWNTAPANGVEDNRYYRWTIPEDIKPGDDYRIEVRSTGEDLPRGAEVPRDSSDNYFSIAMKIIIRGGAPDGI
jgi:hypothetical protein